MDNTQGGTSPAPSHNFKALLFVTTPSGGNLHVMNCPLGLYDSDEGEVIVHQRIDDPLLPAPFFLFTFVHPKPDFTQASDEYLHLFIRPPNVVICSPRIEITPTYVAPNKVSIARIAKELSLSKDCVLEKCAAELFAWLQRDEPSKKDNIQEAFV